MMLFLLFLRFFPVIPVSEVKELNHELRGGVPLMRFTESWPSFGTPGGAGPRRPRALRGRGYRRLDAFTPYPVKGLEGAIGLTRSPLGKMLFPVAMVSAALGYLIQLWCNAWDYPINVGGRPLNSVPASIPITFETGVLLSSLTGVFLFLLLTGLPRLHAPVAGCRRLRGGEASSI